MSDATPVTDLTFRPATLEDSDMILAWRNEPATVPWMARPEPIARIDHEAWFRSRIESDDCLFWIILADGEPVGQIRYDRIDEPSACKNSMNLTAAAHGRRIGTRALRMGDDLVFELGFADRIVGHPHAENERSIRMLERVGYIREGEVLRDGVKYIRYVRTPANV